MENKHRETYVIMRDPHIDSPEAHILENATVEEAKQYLKKVLDDELLLDKSNGWKSTVVCNEEDWDYIVITKSPLIKNNMETRICIMQIDSHKHFK